MINTSTNTIVATVPVGATPLTVAASPDGTRVVVTNQFNTVFVIDAATNTVLTTVNVNLQAVGVAYTPDGSRLYVSRTNGIDIIDPATNTVVGTLSAPGLGVGNAGTSFIGPNIIEAAGGPLSVASDAALTPLGFGQFVNFNGGTLRAAASFSTARTISLLAGGGIIDTNGFNLTLSGRIINSGGLTKAGLGTLVLSGANTYTGGTTLNGGTISVSADNNLGAASGGLTFNGGTLQTTSTFVSNRAVTLNAAGGTFNTNTATSLELAGVIDGTGGLTKTGGGTLLLSGINTYSGGTTINGGSLQLGSALATARIVGSVTNNATLAVVNADLSGVTSITTNAGATTSFRRDSTGGNATLVTNAGGTVDISQLTSTGMTAGSIAGAGLYSLGSKQLTVGSNNLSTTVGGVIADGGVGGGTGGSLVKVGTGTLTLGGANTYTGGTTVTGGLISFAAAGSFGSGAITLNGGGVQWATGNTADIAAQLAALGAGGGTFDTNGNSVTLAGNIGGAGGLTKAGTGTLILGGSNSYSGGTRVSGGTLQGTTASLQGNILNNANVTFSQDSTGTYGGAMAGSGSLTKSGAGTVILSGSNSYTGGTTVSGGVLQGNSASLQGSILNNASVVFNQTGSGTYAGTMSGSGALTLQGGGVLNMTGASTYTGSTTVNASTLLVNGSLASAVTLANGGILGGSGSIGGLVSNGGMVAPGNSIGTLTVNGSFTQNGGTYVVEANATGQSDRVNVNGAATINGASVQLVAAPGSYGTSTTYTILNATGGVSGTYAGVSSNFAFLTPSLSYNANNVFLTLALQGNAFSGFGGNTVNQRAVGYALDQSFANATGDFATVIGALAGLSTAQGSPALNTISGQPYADFGTVNIASNALFMSAVGQQMALARGGAVGGQRQALAQACEVEACQGASPWSVWASALGGLGSVQGNGNSSTLTYNFGGAAAGIDYRFDPRFLLGLSAGYTSGTQWVDSFMGKGWTNAVSVTAYGSFTPMGPGAGFYADALAGYAYSNNQLQRQIQIPGLQRTANGSTGADQFLGQVETGYKVPVYAPAAATVTPFARLQATNVNQAAFGEWGANSLSLNVAQQTTNSLRTTFGADLAGAIGLGDTRTLELALRLGWQHEFADIGRPITAAFAGAPTASFTVFGATPQRDSAVIGFSAHANIADSTRLYLRYDGDIGSGSDNHSLNVGVRMTW